MQRESREERVIRLLFGTSKFRNHQHEMLTYTLGFVFIGVVTFVLMDSVGLRDYFYGAAMWTCSPIYLLTAWAVWRDANDSP